MPGWNWTKELWQILSADFNLSSIAKLPIAIQKQIGLITADEISHLDTGLLIVVCINLQTFYNVYNADIY